MKKLILPLLFITVSLYAQSAVSPRIEVKIRKTLDYERPARLLEEDNKKGVVFQFTRGLEIITDIDAVKVSLFDVESGRTPYENNSIESGYIRIKLEKPGYQDYSFWVNVKDNYRTTVLIFYKNPSENIQDSPAASAGRGSSPLFSEINPGDPSYYRQLYFMNADDGQNFESAVISSEKMNTLISLSPEPMVGGSVFLWDGHDAEGNPVDRGDYSLRMIPFGDYKIRVDQQYSRQALNYFSGFSGMALVPSARLLFKRGFQFGSTFGIERTSRNQSHDYNLPFSFFLRVSPVKRWEASLEAETAFVTESERPTLRINSSQKVYLFDIQSLQLSLGVRGSYKSAINDFSEEIESSMIRDPSGVSLFVPVQYRIQRWDFFGSPELIYTLRPLSDNIHSDEFDITGALRWGVMYSSSTFFSTGLSSVLYFPSYRGNPLSIQASIEGTLYVPGTPLYINLFGVIQKVHGTGDGTAFGMNLGFVL